MTQPTEELIIWANTDVNLPELAGPNKTRPTDDLILKGWDFKQKPAADEFNYVLNNMGQYISYLLNKDTSYLPNKDTTTNTGSNIGILTGTIAHGGTIPLPSGYTEDQCKWMVSVNSITVKNDNTSDILKCKTIGRVVTITMEPTDQGVLTGTANYIIIGVK